MNIRIRSVSPLLTVIAGAALLLTGCATSAAPEAAPATESSVPSITPSLTATATATAGRPSRHVRVDDHVHERGTFHDRL